MRLNVTCIATPEHPVESCPVTLRFFDAEGVLLTNPDPSSPPVQLTATIPVRGSAFVDLAGHSFIADPGTRKVVRPVVVGSSRDFGGDRVAMNIEVFDTATGIADIRYAFEPCRTLPLAFVPRAQRPSGFTGIIRELSFAPPGITVDETVSLNVACVADPLRPKDPCRVVLRYSRFESTTSGRSESGAHSPIAEQELTIQPGAIGSFESPGSLLGATTASRAMFRPSVVGNPTMLRRVITSFEIFDPVSGVAHSLYQPPNKRRPVLR
jgi:hypothetical protein